MDFEQMVPILTRAVEIAGVGALLLGAALATVVFAARVARGGGGFEQAYHAYRADLGRAILLGLELLVAADIIGTVAIDPTLDNLAVLALIVLIRTFLSFALEVEVNGRWPWQRRDGDRRQVSAGPGPRAGGGGHAA